MMPNTTPAPSLTSLPPAPNRFAALLRGVGPVGILFVVLVFLVGPTIGAPLVLIWAWWTKVPWRDLGFRRPKSWLLTVLVGIVLGVAFKLFMKAVVMPLIGAPDLNPRYQYLLHNTDALPGMLLMVIFTAGLGEEIIWRGFLFERVGRLIGTSRKALAATVLISATLFGLAHYPEQHWMGVQQAFIMALFLGTYFAITRQIWLLVILHAAFDVFAVLLIYFGLEGRVANLLF